MGLLRLAANVPEKHFFGSFAPAPQK